MAHLPLIEYSIRYSHMPPVKKKPKKQAETFDVEKVLGVRVQGKITEYLVRPSAASASAACGTVHNLMLGSLLALCSPAAPPFSAGKVGRLPVVG